MSRQKQSQDDFTAIYLLANRPYSNLGCYLDLGNLSPSSRPSEVLQEEFNTTKGSVSSIHLPPRLKLSNSRQGLKRESQIPFNTVQRYAEVSLKILSTLPDNDSICIDECISQK